VLGGKLDLQAGPMAASGKARLEGGGVLIIASAATLTIRKGWRKPGPLSEWHGPGPAHPHLQRAGGRRRVNMPLAKQPWEARWAGWWTGSASAGRSISRRASGRDAVVER